MGVPTPSHPGDDPLPEAAWAAPSSDVLLAEAERALAGGDVPRARRLAEDVLSRETTRDEFVEAWDLCLRASVVAGDRAQSEEAVAALSAHVPIGAVRQRIRRAWVRHRPDPEWENALLDAAQRFAGEVEGGAASGTEESTGEDEAPVQMPPQEDADTPPPAASMQRLLEVLADDPEDQDAAGEPDPEGVREFREAGTLFTKEELRSPVEEERVRYLIEDDEVAGALPLLQEVELTTRSPADVHRIVADHPGARGRDLLRRYAFEQARQTSPDELRHSYDMAIEFFGQGALEEAAHLLLPVATIDNSDRLGALELLARALLDLDRLPQAEAYLKEAVPLGRQLRDPAYAPLFYWLGKIAEEKGDPGSAIDYYASAVKLLPDLVEAKRRLQTLLGL